MTDTPVTLPDVDPLDPRGVSNRIKALYPNKPIIKAPDKTFPGKSKEEEFFWVLEPNASGRGNKKIMCRACGTEFTCGPQKMRIHLTGEQEGDQCIEVGSGNKNVSGTPIFCFAIILYL